MNETHKKVEELARAKERKAKEAELLRLAKEDIGLFVISCRSEGFRVGVKAGFWIGIVVALLIYFILN